MSRTVKEAFWGIFFTVIVLAIMWLFGWAVGADEGDAGKKAMKREAVKAGAAEFVATPEGKVEFHWKKPKDTK